MLPEGRLRLHSNYDINFLAVTVVLLIIGLANLYSASYLSEISIFYKQCVWVVCGLLSLYFFSLVDYHIYEHIAYPLYVINILLLGLVLILGPVIAGSQRWLPMGLFNIQPSEFTKLSIILVLARYFSRDTKHIDGYGLVGLIRPTLIVVLPIALIFKEPDLGTSLLVAFIAAIMFFFARIRIKTLALIGISLLIIVPVSYKLVLKDYQRERIQTFLNPDRDPLEKGYHAIQSIITIGSGRFTGKSYLRGTQSKLEFIPKHSTDFIFSVFAEEWGFLGCLVLLAGYLLLLLMGLNIAMKSKDKFGGFLAIGVTALLFWQIVTNLYMELGMIPVVGVTLPLLSYGGSSILTVTVAIGILMNISARRYVF